MNGHAPAAGQLWQSEAQAQTLEDIAATQGESFYRGELAKKMTAHARDLGGVLAESDLAQHKADWVQPIQTAYRGTELHEIPPNGQGIAALMALAILEQRDIARYAMDSADSVHLQVEAMKLAFADVYAHVSDERSMQHTSEALLDAEYLRKRAAQIDMQHATAFESGMPQHGGTVYLTAADAQGMMISFIQSNYLGFGSGVCVPGTGITLQNRGAAFNRIAGHANCVAGGKRPFHTIIPGFLTRNGQPLMSFGVMGGHVQPQGHVQMLVRMLDYGLNPQSASDAPRWVVNVDGTLSLEAGFPDETLRALEARGHRISQPEATNFAYGGAQLIWRTKDGYIAGSDHRKDGCAVGFG
jgi:gamma-glutamyltranspeptidase / glutathione hydrolase